MRDNEKQDRIAVFSLCIECEAEIKEYRPAAKARSGRRTRCCQCLADHFCEARIVSKTLAPVGEVIH